MEQAADRRRYSSGAQPGKIRLPSLLACGILDVKVYVYAVTHHRRTDSLKPHEIPAEDRIAPEQSYEAPEAKRRPERDVGPRFDTSAHKKKQCGKAPCHDSDTHSGQRELPAEKKTAYGHQLDIPAAKAAGNDQGKRQHRKADAKKTNDSCRKADLRKKQRRGDGKGNESGDERVRNAHRVKINSCYGGKERAKQEHENKDRAEIVLYIGKDGQQAAQQLNEEITRGDLLCAHPASAFAKRVAEKGNPVLRLDLRAVSRAGQAAFDGGNAARNPVNEDIDEAADAQPA